jgi:hypothetical protein
MPSEVDRCSFGPGWLVLCLAFVLHVADEATTGFLAVYNATVMSLRAESGWLPDLTLGFRDWLTLMIVVNLILLALTPFAFQGRRWMRPIAYIYAAIQILNAAGHTWGSIMGHSVAAVQFGRPAPGFYSSPFLVAAAVWLLVELRRSSGK